MSWLGWVAGLVAAIAIAWYFSVRAARKQGRREVERRAQLAAQRRAIELAALDEEQREDLTAALAVTAQTLSEHKTEAAQDPEKALADLVERTKKPWDLD